MSIFRAFKNQDGDLEARIRDDMERIVDLASTIPNQQSFDAILADIPDLVMRAHVQTLLTPLLTFEPEPSTPTP